MANFLSSFLGSTFMGKIRLALDYVLIVMVICLAGGAYWFYKQNNALHDATTDLTGQVHDLQGVAKDQREELGKQRQVVDQLALLRQEDNTVVQGLIADYKKLGSTDTSVRAKISELEKRSDQVKTQLDAKLPADVQRVLSTPASASSTGGSG
jgi:chromosome segregation ATPase